MVSTNNLKNGMTLKLDGGELWQVVDWNHHKPGKGGAMVRTKLRNIDSGKTVEKTFRAAEDVEQAVLDKRELQFLYKDNEDFVFMNTETYDQRHVRPEVLAEKANFLVEGASMTVLVYEDRIVDVELPTSVELEITETQPGVAGDTKTNATKPATLETGYELQVPLFINEGERIKVDTRSGEYLSRVMSEPANEAGGHDVHSQAQTYDPRLARRRALEVLFEADVREEAVSATLVRTRQTDGDPVDPFARQLIEGVDAHRADLDALLGEHAHKWSVKRMPKVDRNLLRMAVFELVHLDTPPAVVIDEAVELAKMFAGDRAPKFVNGVLEAVRKQLVRAEPAAVPTPAPVVDAEPEAPTPEPAVEAGVPEPEPELDLPSSVQGQLDFG